MPVQANHDESRLANVQVKWECEGWAFRLLVRISVLISTFLHNM